MKYIANPVEVDAFKITRIVKTYPGGEVKLVLDNGNEEVATEPMVARYTPQAGDYWVVQSDGYIYLNPKDVFERKYHLVQA